MQSDHDFTIVVHCFHSILSTAVYSAEPCAAVVDWPFHENA